MADRAKPFRRREASIMQFYISLTVCMHSLDKTVTSVRLVSFLFVGGGGGGGGGGPPPSHMLAYKLLEV